MTTRPAVVIPFILMTVAAIACGRTSPEGPSSQVVPAAAPSTWAITLEPVTLPVTDSSSTPQLTASAAGVIASWVELKGDTATLKFSERTAAGWSPAATVASGTDWFLSPVDAPSVLRLSTGTLVADWFVATNLQAEAYDTLMSYSKDGGRTWVPSFKPHRDKTKSQHGFATLFELPDAGVGVVWLDGRDQDKHTKDPEKFEMYLRYTSFDPTWKQSADVEVNRRVCECCQTAAVLTPDGVVAAFRDRSDKEIRDIAVSRLDNNTWTDAQIVHADNWEIDSCPVNGPAISARGRDVAVAWFTAKEDQGHAYAAFSHDAGRTWTAPVRLDVKESIGRVDIELLDDGSAAATWVEFADERQRFMMRRVEASGATSAPLVIAGTGAGRVTGYPRVARRQGELVFAWTENAKGAEDESSQQVKGAVAKLPQ